MWRIFKLFAGYGGNMTLDLIHNFHFIHAFIVTIVLAILHWCAPHIRRLPLIPEVCMASFGGGVAVTYVILHMLPELADHNQEIGRIYKDTIGDTPLAELFVFFIALVGFNIYYGFEILARSCKKAGQKVRVGRIYWLHLFAYCYYNLIIAYTMPLRFETGIAYVITFTLAMGLHFVLTDRNLEEHFPTRFNHFGRLILVLALFLGFILAWFTKGEYAVLSSFLVPFLAGSILLNVFKGELNFEKSNFRWFTLGLLFYAVLMGVATWVSE